MEALIVFPVLVGILIAIGFPLALLLLARWK